MFSSSVKWAEGPILLCVESIFVYDLTENHRIRSVSERIGGMYLNVPLPSDCRRLNLCKLWILLFFWFYKVCFFFVFKGVRLYLGISVLCFGRFSVWRWWRLWIRSIKRWWLVEWRQLWRMVTGRWRWRRWLVSGRRRWWMVTGRRRWSWRYIYYMQFSSFEMLKRRRRKEEEKNMNDTKAKVYFIQLKSVYNFRFKNLYSRASKKKRWKSYRQTRNLTLD